VDDCKPLLTGVAAEGKAPYKTVLTHGFVLDEKGESRGLHPSTFQLNLSRFGHTSRCSPV
jgi:hypothetical protein